MTPRSILSFLVTVASMLTLARAFRPSSVCRISRFGLISSRTLSASSSVGDTTTLSDFGSPSFGMTKTLKGVEFDDAVTKTTEALKQNGFGVLTTIDIKEIMKKKLNTNFSRPYVILGACNPGFAHRALKHAPSIGLLLPCNVVVTTDESGDAIVSMLDPKVMFTSVMNEPGMEDMANEVKGILQTALDSL